MNKKWRQINNLRKRLPAGAAALALLFGSAFAHAAPGPAEPAPAAPALPSLEPPRLALDPALPDYTRGDNLTGKLRSVGSSTLSNLLNRWSEDFRLLYPQVEFDVTGGGSATALPALLEGRADIAPMSRSMNAKEIAQFKATFGHEPLRLTVGLDALAVYVHKDNPLRELTMAELEAVFAENPRRGGDEIRRWGQLGLKGEWAERDIVIKAPQRTHGMYQLFREAVLEGGDYRYDMRAEPVSSSIVQGVGTVPGAIGFASHFFASRRTHALAIGASNGGPYYLPTQEHSVSGKYPLARFLYVYVNRKPGTALPPLTAHFLRFICSQQGQASAARDGNFPLDAERVNNECRKLID